MVVFTCNHCGESVHKPRVEKHYSFQCRNYKSLTCVDCFKDFRDEEYTVHTKCITEDERYAAKGSIPDGIVKKGDVKQESWIDMIKSIVANERDLKPSVKNLLNIVCNYTNVPRKKAKFFNFIKSSMGGRVNVNDIEEVWNIIEKKKMVEQNKANPVKQNNVKRGHENGENENNVKRSKSDESEEKNNKIVSEYKFSFKETILKILNEKHVISKKKLQKKVLNAYTKEMECEITEKTISKYNKKLNKTSNILIENDIVKLI